MSVDVSPVLRWNVGDGAALRSAVCLDAGKTTPLGQTEVAYLTSFNRRTSITKHRRIVDFHVI